MGAVYVAEQISTGKPRALKVMLSQLVADATLRKRFEQEARIASLIESEHVVEVVGAGVDGISGLPWLAMELLNGEDLGALVARRGALAESEVAMIFEQLCHAVGAAHRVGVVHRDLKPENIFLAHARRAGPTFMIKVLDFGIAKIVAEASTKQTAAMGSPIWMAPEQADQSPITPATDVWPLGLLAFFLLTGRSYWKSANDENATLPQVLKEILFEPIVPASMRAAEIGAELPAGFNPWFARCLVRDAASRFSDANEASASLAPVFATGASVSVPRARMGGSPPASHAPPPATGVSGSYPLSDPGPPLTTTRVRAKVPMGVAAAVLLAVTALGSLLAASAWRMTKRTTPPVAVVAPTASVAQAAAPPTGDLGLVLDATRLCDEGKYDLAHVRVAQLGATSEARHSAEFKDVETRWATQTLLLAEKALDPAGRRSLLESVARAETIDESLPATARDRIAALEAGAPADVAESRPSPPPPTHSGPSSHPIVPAVIVPPPSVFTAPPLPPPQRSAYDLATSTSSADWWAARRILEPKVVQRTATVEETNLLLKVCKAQRDKPCQKMCIKTLKPH